jgi:hypothetical protein
VESAQHRPSVAAVASADIGRVIALGASNLTLGLPAVVASARAAWGPQVEILAAFGHGRSYGAHSRVAFRRLPSVLESGLWPALESCPRVATRGLVTDVGNDILYGFSAEQTLEWVEEAVRRLSRVTRDVVVTDLPLDRIRRLSNARFLAFRSVLVPSCRLSLTQVLDRAERVSEALRLSLRRRALASSRWIPRGTGSTPSTFAGPRCVRPGARSSAFRRQRPKMASPESKVSGCFCCRPSAAGCSVSSSSLRKRV